MDNLLYNHFFINWSSSHGKYLFEKKVEDAGTIFDTMAVAHLLTDRALHIRQRQLQEIGSSFVEVISPPSSPDPPIPPLL